MAESMAGIQATMHGRQSLIFSRAWEDVDRLRAMSFAALAGTLSERRWASQAYDQDRERDFLANNQYAGG